MRIESFTRLTAFLAHLLISSCVALVSALLVFYVWYPSELAFASGITKIFLILMSVDVVLGPCLTFAIFNKKKKELKRDLLVIGLIQLSALGYGLFTVFVSRPVFLAYNSARFDVVYANDISDENLRNATNSEYKFLPKLGPRYVASPLPQNTEENMQIVVNALTGKGDDVQYLPKYYVDYGSQRDVVIKLVKPLNSLKSFNSDKLSNVDNLIQKYKQQNREVGYLPMIGKTAQIVVLIDAKTAEVLELSSLKPWP